MNRIWIVEGLGVLVVSFESGVVFISIADEDFGPFKRKLPEEE